jgi:ATP-binding cassette subfamily F protein uup
MGEKSKNEKSALQNEKKLKKLKKKPEKTQIKQKLSYKDQREFDQLEKEIEELELLKNSLEESLNSGNTDYSWLEKTSRELKETIELIDKKTIRWLELDESGLIS